MSVADPETEQVSATHGAARACQSAAAPSFSAVDPVHPATRSRADLAPHLLKLNTAAIRTFLGRFDNGFVPRRRRDTRHGGAVGVGTWDLSNASPEELARIEHALRCDEIVVRFKEKDATQ